MPARRALRASSGSFLKKTGPATCSGNQSCITFAAGKIRGPYEKKSCRAGFRNARARHSRVRHDGDFALCRRRLACEHSDCRASDFRLCARRVRRGPGADFRASASAQADFADIGMPDDRGQSVRCGCARLRRADVGALRFGTASRSLFRRGLDRCREAGRRGKRRRGRVDHDRGHDGRQPVRRAARHDAQRGAVLAGHFPAGGLLGVGRAAVCLALGAAGRRFARYRLQGAIPFLSQKGALAVARSDAAGQPEAYSAGTAISIRC